MNTLSNFSLQSDNLLMILVYSEGALLGFNATHTIRFALALAVGFHRFIPNLLGPKAIFGIKVGSFSHETFARGENKNRTLCKEGTVGCALLEDQSFTCLVLAPYTLTESINHLLGVISERVRGSLKLAPLSSSGGKLGVQQKMSDLSFLSLMRKYLLRYFTSFLRCWCCCGNEVRGRDYTIC
jgi:hypothetical protein